MMHLCAANGCSLPGVFERTDELSGGLVCFIHLQYPFVQWQAVSNALQSQQDLILLMRFVASGDAFEDRWREKAGEKADSANLSRMWPCEGESRIEYHKRLRETLDWRVSQFINNGGF